MHPDLSNPASQIDDGDHALVADILSGNDRAFETLMRRHNQRLFRLARAVVKNDTDAEDVVQEAYVNAYANLSAFEGRASVRTWLSRIVYNGAVRARQKKERSPTIVPSERHETAFGRPMESATDRLRRHDIQTVLNDAFDALPENYRVVVMLRLVEGLSTRETAAALGLSETNVKVRLNRAKSALAAALNERSIHELRRHFAFGGARCNRIVATVLAAIAYPQSSDRPAR